MNKINLKKMVEKRIKSQVADVSNDSVTNKKGLVN